MGERDALAAVTGIVFDVQRFSVHDGPGLRTNVFLKGCPLRCGWCANPESQQLRPELALTASNCMTCGQFDAPCPRCWPEVDHTSPVAAIDAGFGLRAELCPTGAMHWVGETRAAGDVMAEVLRDTPFYAEQGGLTLTGGEPTMQLEMCHALLRLAKDAGLTTAMETCGHTHWAVLERLLPFLDTVLYDLKHVDAARHRAGTGVDNGVILANLTRLVTMAAPVVVRVPLIPGFNADAASLTAMCDFLLALDGPLPEVNLLPYHVLGRAKYAALGREYPWRDEPALPEAQVQQLANLLSARGLRVRIGG
jgi:pyruvate formate lyase activating enzyme